MDLDPGTRPGDSGDGPRDIPPTRAEIGPRAAGTVKWFGSKGFGFIATQDGRDAFVHHSSIHAAGFRCLTEGEPVEFELIDEGGQLRAVNVTGPGGAHVQGGAAEGAVLCKAAAHRKSSARLNSLLLRHGYDGAALDRMADAAGKRALHVAAWRGTYASVEKLLARGADVNCVSTGVYNWGKTAL